MAFDSAYYQEKKGKLQQKAQQLQQEYLQNAFKFTVELNDILAELQKIAEWEKENAPKDIKEISEKDIKKFKESLEKPAKK